MYRPLLIILIVVAVSGCTTPYIVATQAVQRGDQFSNSGRFTEAMGAYQEFLTISPQLGMERDQAMEAEVHRKIAASAAALGQYPNAIGHLKTALVADSVMQNRLSLAEDHRQIGMVHGYQGRLQLALRHLTRAHDLLDDKTTSGKDVYRSAAADNDLALARLHLTMGNYKSATGFAQSALRLALPIAAAWQTVADAQLVLGIIYRETGDEKLSGRLLNASRDLAAKNGLSAALQELAIGELEASRGNLQSALQHKLSAIEEARKSNILPQLLQALLRTGDAYQHLGDFQHADYYFQKALEVQQKTDVRSTALDLQQGRFQEVLQNAGQEGARISAGVAALRLAESHAIKGKTDSARLMLEFSRRQFQSAGSADGQARVLLEESELENQSGRWRAAQRVSEAALITTRQPDLLWQAEYQLGRAWEGLNRPDSARAAYQRSVEWIDHMRGNLTLEEFKSAFSNNKVNVYNRYIQLLLDKPEECGVPREQAVLLAFDLNEQSRSRAFLDMLAGRNISPRQDADTMLLRREYMLRLKIGRISNQLQRQKSDHSSHQELTKEWLNTQTEHQQMIRQIKMSNPDYENILPVQPPKVGEISASLNSTTALIEYWVGPDAINIWIVRKNSVKAITVRVTQKDLFREITYCRNSITNNSPDAARQSLSKLGEWLIRPALSYLNGISDLVIVPHRRLHFVPFHALIIDNKYLIESHVLRYTPSAAIFARLNSKPATKTERLLAMALGNSKLEGFNALPGTSAEVSGIARLYPGGNIRTSTDFNENILRRDIQSATQIHLATHGVLDAERPLNSYLLMHPGDEDDGHLTINEILDLKLRARLVTLSACETGLGSISEGDELVGLSRAFLYAGSSGIIVSLWKVDDASTAWLMTRFHQYLTAHHPAPTALAMAQRDLLQLNLSDNNTRGITKTEQDPKVLQELRLLGQDAGKNPYFWAPFIFIGNDTP